MWSRDPNRYYADYDLRTIRDKQYYGVGVGAITRDGYKFSRAEGKFHVERSFVAIQDTMDRLNYYIPIDEEEYKLFYVPASYAAYSKFVESEGVENSHRALIYHLFESNGYN